MTVTRVRAPVRAAATVCCNAPAPGHSPKDFFREKTGTPGKCATSAAASARSMKVPFAETIASRGCGEHARERRARIPLPRERRAGMRVQAPAAFTPEHERGGTFRERGAGETPRGGSLAENPVAFLRADDHDLPDVARFQKLGGKVQRGHSHRRIADEGVARAVDAEQRGEMTGGGIIDGLGKEQRARGVRALLCDLLVKAPRVEHAAVADREDHGGAIRWNRAARVFERGESGGDGELADGARAAEARIAREMCDGFRRRRDEGMRAARFGIGERFDFGDDSGADLRPHFIERSAEGRHPSEPRDADAHRASSSTMLAFVPPKPNEFDITHRARDSRAVFATMSSAHAGSGSA